VVLRVAAVTAAVSAIGSAVAMAGRNTAAALGGVFVYMAVLESLVRGFLPGFGRYLLGDNIGTFVTGTKTELFQGQTVYTLTPARGAVVVIFYAGVLVMVAVTLLRTRDVN
jgi:hypothetical protein